VKIGPFARFAIHPGGAAVELGDVLDNGKAETGASHFA
ncbi:uncharacterized protein METZ01_LOCUS110365, partial [marine metagenome]